jgi:nucleoside-diphosphate-sugar epimerase
LSGTRAVAPPLQVGGPVVVTGALGFVAGHLVPRLLERGASVIGIVRPGRDSSGLARAGVEVRFANLAERSGLESAFSGAAAIVHLSGMAQVPPLVAPLEACRVRRGVFVGSTGIYTRLASPGAEAKRLGEASLRESALDYVILRPSLIYGTPGDRNLARLLRLMLRSPVLPLPGGGQTLQQPVHVEDLVSAILAALERPAAARREFDIGGPVAMTLAELAQTAAAALERRVWMVPVPLAPVHAAARLAKRLGMPFPVTPEQVLRLRESKAVEIGPARAVLGFDPRPFSDGIAAEAHALRRPRAQTAGRG